MKEARKNEGLEGIIRALDDDQSGSGYRGATLAFMRCLELSGRDELLQALWRIKSPHAAGSDADCNGFAEWIYRDLWPRLPWATREDYADQARAIAAGYEAERGRGA